MHIKVSGKQIDVGDALRAHVEDAISQEVAKYFDRPVDTVITFSRNGHNFKCDASTHLPTGLTAKASAEAGEIYAAFDQCADRIAKQLRRYKRRLKNHHQERKEPVQTYAVPSYVLAGEEPEAAEEPESLEPVIIAEMTHDMKKLSVGEAVMQMEFAHASFLVFQHSTTGRVNLVFRREDGNIGWIDPGPQPGSGS